MVEPTKEKEGTTIREGKKTRGKVDEIAGTAVWLYMNQKHGLTGEQLVQLKGATCPAKVNDRAATLVRIFDPAIAKEKGVDVQDYASLNDHPELILYEGYYVRGRGGEIIIERREGVGTSLLENKIKEGAITEVGVTKEKTATQKWLGRLVTFLMYGGWFLVLFLGVGIFIAISILTKGC